MANQTTVEISSDKEIEDIEYCENVPPGVIAFPLTSELKDKNGVAIGSSSALQSGQNDHHSAFSTPAPKTGNSKTERSGFPSALTPILKQLNIHNCSFPPTFVNSSELKAPPLSFCNTVTNPQRVTASNQSSNTDITRSLSRRSLLDANTPVCWLVDECLPEITFLDVTCDTTEQLSKNDSALPDSMPSTPVTDGFMHTFNSPMPLNNRNPDVIQSKGAEMFCPQTNSLKRKPLCKKIGTRTVSETSSNHHQTSQNKHPSRVFHATQDHSQIAEVSKGEMMAGKRSMMADVPESIDAPLRWLDDRYFPEITLLDVTHNSDFSPKGEVPPLEVKQDVPGSGLEKNLQSSALGGEAEAEPGTQDNIHSDVSRTLDANFINTTSSLCEQSDKYVVNNTPKISLGVTRDISMESALEDSRPSLESSGQCTAMIQTSVEGTPDVHPINVTRDISSSSNMSVHCTASHTEHTQFNTSSQNLASEAHCDLKATLTNVTANGQELLTSQLSSMLPEQSLKPTGSVNGTFTIVPHANQNTSVPADTIAQILGPQNKTQDLSPSNGSSPKSQKDVNNQPTSESNHTNESSLQNFSSGMPIDLQNATFEKLQTSTGSSILGEVGATNVNIQNNTFTMKPPKDNGTIIMSETSSSNSHHSALDKPPPSKICHSAKSPNQGCVEALPSETTKKDKTTVTHSDSKTINVHETESDPAVEAVSAAAQFDTKVSSHLCLSMKDGFPDTSGHQSLDTVENKANPFNLDDTLDLKGDALLTSTPMVTCKMFNFSTEREEGKSMAVQKKLYGDGPSKADHQVQADVPSNIVCDRKTFLAQPTAKSMLPPLKTASQLLRYKSALALPGRPDPSVSGLPVTRQKTQAAALRKTDPSQVVGYEADSFISMDTASDILFSCV